MGHLFLLFCPYLSLIIYWICGEQIICPNSVVPRSRRNMFIYDCFTWYWNSSPVPWFKEIWEYQEANKWILSLRGTQIFVNGGWNMNGLYYLFISVDSFLSLIMFSCKWQICLYYFNSVLCQWLWPRHQFWRDALTAFPWFHFVFMISPPPNYWLFRSYCGIKIHLELSLS